jgi:hypothetical protein
LVLTLIEGYLSKSSTTSILPFQQALLKAERPNLVATLTEHPLSIRYLNMAISPVLEALRSKLFTKFISRS